MSRSLVSSRLTFAAKARPFVPVAAEGTSETDWLPEEDGFEPSVPLPRFPSRGKSRGSFRTLLRHTVPGRGDRGVAEHHRQLAALCTRRHRVFRGVCGA